MKRGDAWLFFLFWLKLRQETPLWCVHMGWDCILQTGVVRDSMKFPVFADLEPLIARGEITHFSFDVFDTFLLRRCALPMGVYERAYHHLPTADGDGQKARNYLQYRQNAEQEARYEAAEYHDRHDVSISDIYRHFPLQPFGLKSSQRELLAVAEFAAEKELCFVHDQALALYLALQQAGVKVGFISDIYWPGDWLADLLTHCAPGLRWDFLYASCDYAKGKGNGLLDIYLKDQKIKPQQAAHIGDNPSADIKPARALGMRSFHCPQMSTAEASVYQRESHVRDLFCTSFGLPLHQDGGLRALRRRVMAMLPEGNPLRQIGALTMGPAMLAFDRFVEQRLAALQAEPTADGTSRRVGVAFLARDGFFPLQVWQQRGHPPAAYLAINRRVAVIAGSYDLTGLERFFHAVPGVSAAVLEGFFKTSIPAITQYFARQPGGTASGKDFARALPALLSADELLAVTDSVRATLLAYLRRQMPDFDSYTDLLLIDVGYGGTVQHALRKVFDQQGLPIRLHGAYMILAGEGFSRLADDDSAVGMLSDEVIVPHTSLALRRNVAILEQICSAPEGSVSAYDADGVEIREDDPRDPAQLQLCEEIRQGAYDFIRQHRALPPALWDHVLADPEHLRVWGSAALMRLLLVPTDDELLLLKDIKLDVNLGSQVQLPLLDVPISEALAAGKSALSLFRVNSRLLWPAASLAMVSPQHGYLYSLFTAGLMPGDVFGEARCGSASLMLITDGQPQMITVSCLRTAENLLRLRIPVSAGGTKTTVAIPLDELAPQGQIQSLMWSGGKTAAKAMADSEPVLLPLAQIQGANVTVERGLFAASGPQPHLLIEIPARSQPVGLLTITVRLEGQGRLLALNDQALAV